MEGVAKKNDLYFAREEKNFRLSHKFTLAALRLVTGFALDRQRQEGGGNGKAEGRLYEGTSGEAFRPQESRIGMGRPDVSTATQTTSASVTLTRCFPSKPCDRSASTSTLIVTEVFPDLKTLV